MAMKCNKCGGIIPDIRFNGGNFDGCDGHIKQEINYPMRRIDVPCTKGETK